ncbi:MAG: hypothetical protein ACREBE_01750 [bacterium]
MTAAARSSGSPLHATSEVSAWRSASASMSSRGRACHPSARALGPNVLRIHASSTGRLAGSM